MRKIHAEKKTKPIKKSKPLKEVKSVSKEKDLIAKMKKEHLAILEKKKMEYEKLLEAQKKSLYEIAKKNFEKEMHEKEIAKHLYLEKAAAQFEKSYTSKPSKTSKPAKITKKAPKKKGKK